MAAIDVLSVHSQYTSSKLAYNDLPKTMDRLPGFLGTMPSSFGVTLCVRAGKELEVANVSTGQVLTAAVG